MFRCFNLRHVYWHLSCNSAFCYSLYLNNAWLLSTFPPTALFLKLVQLANRSRRISSTIGAASLNEPKKNNRTANSAYRLRSQVFRFMTPVGKVAADARRILQTSSCTFEVKTSASTHHVTPRHVVSATAENLSPATLNPPPAGHSSVQRQGSALGRC